ncbi:MAG: pyruvate synthase subunit beta [Candidatus Diapherotrites archaeon]|nr:pyruvate synthase subunit beta [Candidatus Diapherotrites archaeon]
MNNIPAPNELLAPGHRTCAGCGAAIAIRQMLRAAGKNTVVCEATGCMEVTSTPYPETSWRVPWIHVTFENAAAVASGVREALNRLGKEDVNVIALAGDGGTADIGFQCLSGMLERGHNVLYVMYDNEAYMNTGVQRSSSTPWGASTTTSPAGKVSHGKDEWKKNVAMIAAAHGVPYVATASIGYPEDFQNKIKKALSIKGAKFIQVHCPCPIGWGFDTSDTIKYAKLAVETGLWALYEVENGKLRITYKPSEFKPVAEYLKGQKRFRHLKDDEIAYIQERARKDYEYLERLQSL